MGGQDKQGFPMKQGVLVPGRVRVLMAPGDSCFRGHGRRKGERRRKSVRGCIVSPDLSVLNLVVVKKGEWMEREKRAKQRPTLFRVPGLRWRERDRPPLITPHAAPHSRRHLSLLSLSLSD